MFHSHELSPLSIHPTYSPLAQAPWPAGGTSPATGLNPLWWLRQVFLISAGLAFLAFGIQVLIAAYTLGDPFSFIMTFFAASFIILISLSLIVGFVFQAIQAVKERPGP